MSGGTSAPFGDPIRHQRLYDPSGSSSGGAHNTDYTTEDTATTVTNGSTCRPVNSSNKVTVTAPASKPPSMKGGDCSLTAAGVASVAAAAMQAKEQKNKPKIAYEVRPFTKESLEKINLRTSNLIRDYGFLPKRKPNLMDGAELPAKYEPFPPELLGKPVEEIDQYVYEKVNETFFLSSSQVESSEF